MTFRTAAAAVLLSALVYQPAAHAYIDPGTGSLIIQGLIAAVVGATFALKNFYYTKVKRVIDFVLGRKPAPTGDGEAASSEPPADKP